MFLIKFYPKSNNIRYYSKHAGSIYIQCSCANITSSQININDKWLYDTAQTDKSSKYSIIPLRQDIGSTLSYGNNQYIVSTNNVGENGLAFPIVGTNFKVEYDVYVSTSNGYCGAVVFKDRNNFFGMNNASNNVDAFSASMINGTYSETNTYPRYNIVNKWLHCELTIENNSLVYKIYYNDALQSTKSITLNSTVLNDCHWGISFTGVNETVYLKNIDVTEL